jgi:hypothetical protein
VGCHEVDVANAIAARIAQEFPIHGAFRQIESDVPFPLITCAFHCTACNLSAGGGLDLSGDVGPTDGPSAARSLLGALAHRGCTHATEVVARFADFG